MTDKEQITTWIDRYVDLQRIKHAENMGKEVEYQIKVAKAMLETLGIPTEDLEMKDEQD